MPRCRRRRLRREQSSRGRFAASHPRDRAGPRRRRLRPGHASPARRRRRRDRSQRVCPRDHTTDELRSVEDRTGTDERPIYDAERRESAERLRPGARVDGRRDRPVRDGDIVDRSFTCGDQRGGRTGGRPSMGVGTTLFVPVETAATGTDPIVAATSLFVPSPPSTTTTSTSSRNRSAARRVSVRSPVTDTSNTCASSPSGARLGPSQPHPVRCRLCLA